ncbi:MAG: MMPL family transporter, partial [Desulfobacterales bacterium]|nr:MMPL family transporter [Desulfobacterales bacterium]
MMNEALDKANEYFEKIPDALRKHRWVVWIVFILLTVGVSFGMTRLTIDMSLEAFFEKKDPVKKAYDRFRVLFGGDENVYIVYKARDGDIFSPASLKAVHGIQEDLLNYRLKLAPGESSPLDHITDVKTIINVKYLEAGPDSLVSRSFIGNEFPENETERENYRRLALKHHEYPLLHLSRDSRYGGILIKTDFNAELVYEDVETEAAGATGSAGLDDEEEGGSLDDEDEEFADDPVDMTVVVRDAAEPVFKKTEMHEYSPFVIELRKILDKSEYAEAFEIYPVGNPMFMSDIDALFREELKLTVGLLILLIMIMVWILFRSLSAVVWSTSIVALSMVWVVGLIGLTGTAMTGMIQIIVYLVLAIGVADAVHILSGYIFFRNQNLSHEEALRAVFKKSGLACFLTSLTTSVGLVSLIFVPIVPIQSFGVFASLGILFAFAFTIILLPIMLDIWSPFSKRREKKARESGGRDHVIQKFLRAMEEKGYRFQVPALIVFALVGVFFLVGVFKVRVDYNMIQVLDENFHIRKTYELVDRSMGGTGNMEILIDTGEIDGMKDPDVLTAMENIQNHVETEYKSFVINTHSLVDVTKDSYKTINEGREEMSVIPRDPRVLDQTLFLFNSANGKDRRQLVTDDYRIGRVGISLKNLGSAEAERFMKRVEAYMADVFKPLEKKHPDINITITGQFSLLARILNFLSWAQIKSFGLTLTII